MSVEVAVIGAGRMGSVVFKQLPPETKKVIINKSLAKAKNLAEQVNGEAYDTLAGAKDADLIAVVLPPSAVNETINELLKIVKKGAVIINMATSAQIDPEIFNKNRGATIINAKIIGHARSIEIGEPAIIVLDTAENHIFTLIKSQLGVSFQVVQGDSNMVSLINTIGSTEGLKTAVAIRKQLRSMNIPDEWTSVVIRTVCAGTIRSFIDNDLGHFAMELVKKLETAE